MINILTTCFRQTAAVVKQNLLTAVLLNILPLAAITAAAQNTAENDIYGYVMNIDRSNVARMENKVVVSLQLTAIQDVPARQSIILSPELVDTTTMMKATLPLIIINSRSQQRYFERGLYKEYPDALVLPKKNGQDLKVEYLRSIPYQSWMEKAVLKLKKLSCICERNTARGEETLTGLVPEKKVVQVNLYPAYILPPADKSQKVREEKGSAYLCFVVNKWDIKPDYMTNPAELQKIHNSVNVVKSDSDVTISKMTIEGYASPEGNYPHNVMLSRERTNSLKEYLLRTGIVKGFPLEASGKGENWDGFVEYLKKNSFVPERDRLLSIATSYLDPDQKERQMRSTARVGYDYALKNIFPALRCTNYTVTYIVRPFTLEESERVFETKPTNLNINEIYRLADKYADNKEKYYAIMRKASMIYPDDDYINLTMACLAIKDMNTEVANEYLAKVKDCPEKTLNEGIIAYLKGDLQKAILLVDQAMSKGLPNASQQMEEFKKLEEYKTNK